MPSNALIFGHDPHLNRLLSSQLSTETGGNVQVVSNAATARNALGILSAPYVFVDLRPELLSSETKAFIAYLANEFDGRMRFIPLSEGFLPVSLAEHATSLAVEHLDVAEISRDGRRIAEILNSQLPLQIPRRPFPIRAGSTLLETYTDALHPVLEQVVRVATHNVTMLLVGETGTGKTTLANCIHHLSERASQPFQNVACGALPPDLIESELFGHVRGAFTSADRSKIGRFEAAGHGTILLDEIDVLSPKEQAKLLRVIETGEFEPVGSTETRRSHARLIVASNVDLETLTQRGNFRSDLYYRLNVLEFRLPPLRDRYRDIVPMAMRFVRECSEQHGVPVERVQRQFLDALMHYTWPGNIRELKNQIQRTVLFSQDGCLTIQDLTPAVLEGTSTASDSRPQSRLPRSLAERVADSEQEILMEALQANDFKRTATARALGISRVGLYKKMRKYGLMEINAKSQSSSVAR